MKYKNSEQMAIEHVEWFLKIIKPILIEHMIHGYKHGVEDILNKKIKYEK